MTQDCIFCRIIAGEIPARVVYEDEQALAIHDIAPQAPVHVLVIPKQHIESLAAATDADSPLLGRLLSCASHVARALGVADSGYRVAINVGKNGGMDVYHLHIHVLGGRRMAWPPG